MRMKDKLVKVWTPYVRRGSPFWRIRRRYYLIKYWLYGPPPQDEKNRKI